MQHFVVVMGSQLKLAQEKNTSTYCTMQQNKQIQRQHWNKDGTQKWQEKLS